MVNITKGTPLDEMIRAIKKIYQGGRYFSQDVAEQLADVLLSDNANSPFDLLSDREKQVAMMVVNCQSPQQIADQLFVSVKTINTYRYRIYEKVGVDSDVEFYASGHSSRLDSAVNYLDRVLSLNIKI